MKNNNIGLPLKIGKFLDVTSLLVFLGLAVIKIFAKTQEASKVTNIYVIYTASVIGLCSIVFAFALLNKDN